jgi:hypothetical protein
MAKYLFFRMPKTASSFLEKYLKDSGYKTLIDLHEHIYLYKEGKKIIIGVDNCYEYRVCFVREPLARFIGACRWILSERDPAKMYNRDIVERESILQYGSLENFCLNLQDWISKPEHSPIHFYPQYSWITDESGNLTMDFVGKYESMNEDWEKICQKINIPYEPIWNKHLSPEGSRTDTLSMLPKPNSIPNFEIVLTEKMVDIVKNVYQKDYELFYT